MLSRIGFLTSAIAILGVTSPLNASAGVVAVGEDVVSTESHDDHDHEFKRHHLGLFLGYVRKDTEKRKEGGKIGLEYEYQFHQYWGVRGFVDYEGGDLNTWLYGAGVAFHVPKTHLILFAGGAFEREHGKNEEFLRLAAEYKFKLRGGYFLAPVIGYDAGRTDHSAWFGGVMVGTSF